MRKIEKILNFIKTIWFNYKVFPREIARKRPVKVSYRTKCEGLYRGCIEFKTDKIRKNMVWYGIDEATKGLNGVQRNYLIFHKGAKLYFDGEANLAKGVSIRMFENAKLEIGDKIYANKFLNISCSKNIKIGKNCFIGWNVNLQDADGHKILDADGNRMNENQKIEIGEHVWIAAHATLLKGAIVPDECVVGYKATIAKRLVDKNSIYVGENARKVKENIKWES